MNPNPNLFNKEDLRTFFEGRRAEMHQASHRLSIDEVAEESEARTTEQLSTLARIEPLCLNRTSIQVSEETPLRDFTSNEMQPEMVKYHIPFRGCPDLFSKRPPQRRNMMPYGKVVQNEVEVLFPLDTADKVKAQFAHYLVELSWWIERVNSEVRDYNDGLRQEAAILVAARREALRTKHEFYAQLGYPRKRV